MQNRQDIKVTKLSHEILGFLGVTLVISLFLFAFLYLTAISISELYFESRNTILTESSTATLRSWIRNISVLAVLFFFIALFLTLLSQKFSYLREIIRGVDALRIHRMNYEVLVEGNDELTELAERINYLSQTERKLAEQEMRLAEEKKQFIRALSHDIRNPLTAMLSYTEYLLKQKEPNPEELRAYLDMIQRKARQMKELSDQLLENSERKTEYIEDGRCLMIQLSEDWLESLDEKFSCSIDLRDCPRFCGDFDVRELQRIFDNLASNIEKYADDTKAVSLRIFAKRQSLHLIQKNTKKKLREETESHRIGLSSIRHILASYGGKMDIQEDEELFCIHLTFENIRFL